MSACQIILDRLRIGRYINRRNIYFFGEYLSTAPLFGVRRSSFSGHCVPVNTVASTLERGFFMVKRYLLYLGRWQLSTPILAFCVAFFAQFGDVWATIIANLIGGLVFFWVDRVIFTRDFNEPVWSVKSDVVCTDCGRKARGYRLVYTGEYDRRKDHHPEFRCESCSERKLLELEQRGSVAV